MNISGPFADRDQIVWECVGCWTDYYGTEKGDQLLHSGKFVQIFRLIEQIFEDAVVDGEIVPHANLGEFEIWFPSYLSVSAANIEFQSEHQLSISGPVPISIEDYLIVVKTGTHHLTKLPDSRANDGFFRICPAIPIEVSLSATSEEKAALEKDPNFLPRITAKDLIFPYSSVGKVLQQLGLKVSGFTITGTRQRLDPLAEKIQEFVAKNLETPANIKLQTAWDYVLTDGRFDETEIGISFVPFTDTTKNTNVTRENFGARLSRAKNKLIPK